jgi:hypothetical protein
MKKIIIILSIFLVVGSMADAEENYPYSVGPAVSMKAGINGVNTPQGRKNGLAFNSVPDFGVSSYIPVSKSSKLGAIVDIMYNNYSYNIENVHSGEDYAHEYSYLTFGASLYFKGLTMGFVFGTPLSASYGADIDTENISTMTEFKISGIIPLMNDETGRLNLFIRAGYMLSGIYDDFGKHDPLKETIPAEPPEKITNEFNPRGASIAIGFNYLFTLDI